MDKRYLYIVVLNLRPIKVACMYKAINSLAPIYLCNLFTENPSRDIITMRISDTDLSFTFMNAKIGQKSFSYREAQP